RRAAPHACPRPGGATRVRDRRAGESPHEWSGGSARRSRTAPLRSVAATRPDTRPAEWRATTRQRRRDTAGALPRTSSRCPLTWASAIDDSPDWRSAHSPDAFDRGAYLRVARGAAISRQANGFVGDLVAREAVARVTLRNVDAGREGAT